MDRWDPEATSRENLLNMILGGQSDNNYSATNSSDKKRKQPTDVAVPSGKRQKTNLVQIISYMVNSLDIPFSGNALLDHVIQTATLLPADAVLEPLKSYWFVSPIELLIQPLEPPIEIWATVQHKEYYLYLVFTKAEAEAGFYDTSGNLLALVEWQFRVMGGGQAHPLTAFLNNYSRVQEALGSNYSGSPSTTVREDMWNKFTQTDQYKQLTQNNGYDNNVNNNRSYNNTPSLAELPDSLKFLVRNESKTQPQATTVPHSSFYNVSPTSSTSSLFEYDVSDGSLDLAAEQNLDIGNGRHIPFWQINLGKFIGEGSYGKIYRAEYNNQTYAVKQFKDYEFKKEAALKEAEACMNLRHKHIVSLVGITTVSNTDEIMLVMEYMENGSLEDLLVRDKIQLSREDVIRMGLDIAKGLHFLHAQKIIHRDLKSGNVLLYDNKKRAKLSDFGTVRIFGKSSKATTIIGTMGFIAPEILCEIPYDAKADVYSFGVLLYHMLTLKMFPAMFQDPNQVSTRIKDHVKDLKFQELIINCCKREPELRPSIDDCIAALVKMQYEIKP